MLLTPDTDFVNGMKMTRQDPGYRVFAGNLHKFVMRWSFWLPVTDVDCDFRRIAAQRGRASTPHAETAARSASSCEVAHRAGAQFREVSVHHYARAVRPVAVLPPGRIARTYLDIARMWLKLMVFGACPALNPSGTIPGAGPQAAGPSALKPVSPAALRAGRGALRPRKA